MLQGMERIHGPMPPCHIRNGMQIPNGFPHLPNHANLPFSAIQMACAQVMERTRAGAPPVQPQPAGPIMLPNGRIQMPPLVSLPAHHPAGRKTPTRPVHHTSPVQQRQMQPPPPPPALPRPPSLPVQGPPSAHKQTPVGLLFSQEDLDMVLYGYARNKGGDQLPGHALSGLRLGDLSPAPTSPYHRSMHAVPTEAMMGHCPAVSTNYGIDRILGGSPNSKLTLPAPRPIDTSLLDIPDGLGLYQTTFAGTIHCGIYCRKTVIPRGTKFGPFQGKQVNTSEIKTNDDNTFMWEVFQEGRLSHFVDGRGASGNWMSFVNCARYAQEQNLLAVQTEGAIFYEACKDIPQGTELLVWYGDCYLQFMGIPVALKEMADLASQEELENSEGFRCDRCGKVFAYKYYRDKHLKYTRCVDQGDRKFPCHLCTRSFEKRDRLRIHILHVHEKHRPHKCTVCGKSFSQSSSLNKHMRVHSGERPYKCVYCSKAFTASSILRTHIRQHSGEKPFKCKHCGKAFASHAAHDSHVRRTHTRDKPVACDVCGKLFQQVYELRFHMRTHEGTIINTRPNTVDMMTSFRQTGCDDAIDVVNLERTDGHVIPAL